jgi:hypothetical protein
MRSLQQEGHQSQKEQGGQVELPFTELEFDVLMNKVLKEIQDTENKCQYLPNATLPNGSRYTGEWNNQQKRHGLGI